MLYLVAYYETPSDRKAKEWMYSYPDFITKRPPYNHIETEYHKIKESLESDLHDHVDSSPQNKFKNILARGYENWSKGTNNDAMNFSIGNYTAVVIDVGQHKQINLHVRPCDAEDLDLHLHRAHSIKDAKKRFQ